jgi:hypothetical protein
MSSDGTCVFYYHDSKQHNIENFGTTIKGIAAGQLLHPDHPDFIL